MFSSYTSLKVVHDQMLQEAMVRQRPDDGYTPPRHGFFQTVGKGLERLALPIGRKQRSPLPDRTEASIQVHDLVPGPMHPDA